MKSDVVLRPPSAPRIDAYNVAVKYAVDVLNGTIVAGKLLKLTAKRFISDLKVGPARGITLDKIAAQHAVDFFGTLRHSQGEWGPRAGNPKGDPFVLSPWQTFIVVNLFGFKRADGTRRFRKAHIEVARKNGKTTFMAGIGLYMLVADDEPGAQVFVIATTRDQSKEVFDEAVRMRNKSPYLAARVRSVRNNLHVLKTASKFEPQSSDYGTADGKNVHCMIADELHQHPTRLLYDAYAQATGARRQPFIIAITTAGYDTHGVCYSQRNIIENILTDNASAVDGDSFFGFIACIDEEDKAAGTPADNPMDEACWPKANPNLGISVKMDNMREEAAMARIDATALNSFLCKRLNVWVNQEIRWMDPAKWALCNSAGPLVDPHIQRIAAEKTLAGRVAIAGLDLSNKHDLTAFALVFPPCKPVTELVPRPQTRQEIQWRIPQVFDEVITTPADLRWSVLVWFWVPEGCIQQRVKEHRVPYDVWKKQGYLRTCPGNSIDHEYLYKDITELSKIFQFKDIGFDAWDASWIAKKMVDDGFKAESCRPNYSTMNEPMKELMGMVLDKKLEHYGDPILSWNAGNVAATTDANGSIRPDKDKSKEKIDGIVAVIMAMSRICKDPTLAQNSVYSERGIIFL
jgi:phage terminase large subunit-like protein